MAKKGRQAKARGKKKAAPPKLPDRRALEGAMWGMFGRGGAGTSALEQAQEIMYQAFDEDDPEHRVALARKALDLCPDCADAYAFLAEHADSRKEALELYRQGVAAGERAVGQKTFQQGAGHFWGILETRPYMRARMGLANVLWTMGEREEAVGHLQEMLRLNPNDNQGVRYVLAGFLLGVDRDEDLAKLLSQYPDEGSAMWAYTKALLGFRRNGDTAETRQLLKAALKTNKHVPPYLFGEKAPPLELPDSYSPGQDSEAQVYLSEGALSAWKSTAGAVAWVKETVRPSKNKTPPPSQAAGPLPLVKARLAKLSQVKEVWQLACARLPTWIEAGKEHIRPWLILAADRTNNFVLASEVLPFEPGADLLWDTLAKAMESPLAGKPHRPTLVQATPGSPWHNLRHDLEEMGIAVETAVELDMVNAMLQEFGEGSGDDSQPGLLDVPGVTPETAGRFFAAAAGFYTQAPWKKIGYESAIRIACPKFPQGPWYAVVMGQSGMTFGLTLYHDLALLQRLFTGRMSEEANARETEAFTVIFGEAIELPIRDLEAAERHGWKVARPDAYPWVFRKEEGMSVRPVEAWELELLEGSLRVVPDFVAQRRQNDPTPLETTAAAASGLLPLTLAWVL